MALIASFLLAFIPALIYAGIVFWLDRYEKEPKRLIFGSFIWGAVIAAGGAYILNTLFGIGIYLLTDDEFITETLTGSISAPLIEEILKGFAVLIVFLFFRYELDSILDGIVYAAITALGFAATENVLYMHQYGYLEEGWEGLWSVFFLRVILNGWSHAAYTAFTGIGFAIARLSKGILLKLFAPLAGLAIAIGVHFFHNTALVFVESLGGMLLVYLTDWFGWLVIIAIIAWAIWRERKWIELHLKEEVASGLISKEQYRIALSPFQRTLEKINRLGSGDYRKTHHFYQLITTLAFKKQHVRQTGDQPAKTSALIAQIREEVEQISESL
ncbi:MAG: PrsW family intramembrane metalloprotease [Chloroflexota bacterium]